MERSAPKRRKTSSRTAIAINNNSDSSEDNDDNNKSTTPTGSPPGPASRLDRPSFASPTRASLARHNPDILDRRRPAPATSNDTADPSGASGHPSSSDVSAIIQAQLDQDLGGRDRDATWDAPAEDLPHLPRSGRPSHPRTGGSGGLRAPPKRTPNKLPPRPLPPPGPEDEEPVLYRGRGRNQFFKIAGARAPAPEPELPPTPEHPDPEVNTPPSGIHHTPSKRSRRARGLSERLKNSPSKLGIAAYLQSKGMPTGKAPPSTRRQGLRRPESPRVETHDGAATGVAHPQTDTTTLALRGLKPPGPQTGRENQRDKLLASIARLQADLDVLRQENRRSEEPGADTSNAAAALDAVRRHLLPKDAEPTPDPATQWLQMATNPISFLSFMRFTAARPNLLASASSATKEEEAPPLSHHPIPMSVEEELPFLQVFTPLAFTCQIAILPHTSPGERILQQHTISASSASPAGLFTAQIELTVDVQTHKIETLSVPRLDPAAAPELGPFISSIIATKSSNSTEGEHTQHSSRSLRNNVSVLAWAMGEWIRVATGRARFWHVLERELANKEDMAEAVARARARKRRTTTAHRRRDEADADASVAAGDLDQDDSELGESDLLSRAELLPYMGRTSVELGIPAEVGSEDAGGGEAFGLRVQWRIQFDWTGEAQSQVELLTGVPGKWRAADARGNLADINGLFGKLVQGDDDPIVAVRAIVALLVGDAS